MMLLFIIAVVALLGTAWAIDDVVKAWKRSGDMLNSQPTSSINQKDRGY